MKQLPTDFLGFTEIGGVGEMIYTAVRFPAYVAEYDHCGDHVIKPLFCISIPPKAGTDYHLTGQDLLVSLCSLYRTLNAPDSTVDIPEAIRQWCTDNVLPYNCEVICSMVNQDKYAIMQFNEEIQREGTFYMLTKADNLNYNLLMATPHNGSCGLRRLFCRISLPHYAVMPYIKVKPIST